MRVDHALHRGREAFGRQAWGEVYARLSDADAVAPLGADDLELLAIAAFLTGRDEPSVGAWARAHSERLRSRDVPRAVRCAFWMILELQARGELARAGGWLARAQRLLDEGRHDCPECGLLLVLVALGKLTGGDADAAHATFGRAAEIGDRFGDSELKVLGRLGRGQAEAMRGNAPVAMALFDEVMVAATVGEVSPIAVGIVYCAVIDACHAVFDLRRVREWTAALAHWCSSQPDLVPFRGQCLVQRAAILRLSGAWADALEEARRACGLLARPGAAPAAPSPGEGDLSAHAVPVGAALYQVGEIHRMRGELAEALDAYRLASRYGRSPEPGLALLRMAQGRVTDAEAAIRRVLDECHDRLTRADVLAACVDVMIAAGDRPTARAAADELQALAARIDAPFLRALSAQAGGRVLLAEGDPRAARAALRAAWMAWQELEAPYDAARVRVLMGLACRELDDEDAAELELDAAREVFQRLGAAPDVTRVDELLARTAPAAAGGLTPREMQVIGLVAAGRTNRAIARELAISERTVDRHVSNILTKLGVPSRSAATAYAYEHGLV